MTSEIAAPTPASAPRQRVSRRLAVSLVLGAAIAGIAIGTTTVLLTRPSTPSAASLGTAAESWPAGVRPAPGFSLRDQNGSPVSLAALRGRTVIVTFIDPLCRSLCPVETKVLAQAIAKLPSDTRPAVLAVSVNRWGNARRNLVDDERHWGFGPEWRWAVGSPQELAAVWRSYSIGVQATTKVIAGVTVHDIAHTEAAYVIDATGHERALFVWPYGPAEVERVVASLEPGSSA